MQIFFASRHLVVKVQFNREASHYLIQHTDTTTRFEEHSRLRANRHVLFESAAVLVRQY